MKCMIVHPANVAEWRALIGKYPGEDITIKEGRAKADFFCDADHRPRKIHRGDPCFAVTISTKDTPYSRWEGSYLDPL